MLQLFLGRAGSGKTTAITQALAADSDAKERILLVPDQFTYVSERVLLDLLGPRQAQGIRIVGFSHLAEAVSLEVGRPTGKPLDDTARVLLMSRALEQVADRLQVYRRYVDSAQYIRALVDAVGEYRQCGITPEMFAEAAEKLPEGALRHKTAELALVFGAYDALIGEEYCDPQDDLTRLAAQIPHCRFLADADVYIDSFRDFTAQEMRVLEALLCRARRLTVALCTDTLQDEDGGYGLFSPVIRTALHLRMLAREHGIREEAPRYFTQNHRAQNAALAHIEAYLFRPQARPLADNVQDVTVTLCADIHEECRYVADAVRRLLREEGARCRDIAVVVRHPEDYCGLLDVAFETAGVPYYMDRRRDIVTEPPVLLVTAALRAAATSLSSEDILALFKCGLCCDSTTDDIAALEDYVYIWRIGGHQWEQPWAGNPRGFSVVFDEGSRRELDALNAQREAVIAPLMQLRRTLFAAPRLTGRDFAAALWRYLEHIGAGARLGRLAERLQTAGDPDATERFGRLWDLLMGQLDRFCEVLGDVSMTPTRFATLFSMAAAGLDIGTLPQGLDTVQVGSADRMRFSSPKHVFLLGANEGVFPAETTAGGLFTDHERRYLLDSGLPLTDTPDLRNVQERFCTYTACAAPSQTLHISYLAHRTGGEAMLPSVIVSGVKALFPACQTRQASTLLPESAGHALLRLAHTQDAVQAATLEAVLSRQTRYAARLDSLRRAENGRTLDFADPSVASDFFGDFMALSPSKVDKFHQCGFAYFCKYGLKLRPRLTAELNAMEFGTLVHYVCEHQVRAYLKANCLATLTKQQVENDAGLRAEEYIHSNIRSVGEFSERFKGQLRRLKQLCGALMWRMVVELRQSRFVPAAFELGIGMPGKDGLSVPAITFTADDGTRVQVVGQIDRVDTFERDGITYVRVIDYKTGKKEFNLSDVADGISLQMLIYLFSLCEKGMPGGVVPAPAGVLYLPASLPQLTEKDTAETPGEIEEAQLRKLCMNGLLLDDETVLRAMEIDLRGMFIPVKLDSKGKMKTSHLATFEQFGQLRRKIERVLCDMATDLREGKVDAVPLTDGKQEHNPCRWCDYKTVCHHGEGDATRTPCKLSPDDVWALLREEEEDG